MKKSVLKSYAHLIAAAGVNIQKGQEVVIQASLDQPEFIRILVEECYKCGASDVLVLWSDPSIAISNFKHKKIADLSTMVDWEDVRWQHWHNTLPCRIYIESDSPDALLKINMEKYGKATKAKLPLIRRYRDDMDGKYQWCIAGVPSIGWAKKVFPTLSKSQAVKALWEAILKVSRAYDGDPIENWKEHDIALKEKCQKLNDLDLKELHYTAKNGTDFKVGLIKDVIWLGGGEEGQLSRIFYQPNIPSEECFTSPMKGEAEGIVYASKPLSYRGQIIDKFWFKFHEGKVIDYDAKVGKELLKQMLEVDEFASYLGECALIPFDSPINNTGLLFFSTLYDENASCHLALGTGFPTLMKGNETMTLEEITKKGINHSGSHVDFMIGTKDLSIVGIDRNNNEHQIFKDGNWAI
jgi:Leucyl aminopeptidase (aminopeptidase T)